MRERARDPTPHDTEHGPHDPHSAHMAGSLIDIERLLQQWAYLCNPVNLISCQSVLFKVKYKVG